MIKVGIIDGEFGNIASLVNAVHYLNYEFEIIKKPKNLDKVTHLFLPGVGSFYDSTKKLRESGLAESIKEFVKSHKPLMGICLGMQLLFEEGTEDGKQNGLGFFEGKCESFNQNLNLQLPHIGFNNVNHSASKIWNEIPNDSPFYFVHSYRVISKKNNEIKKNKTCSTFYGENFISFIEKDNIFGAQFHPEKSHQVGLKLIKNFIELT